MKKIIFLLLLSSSLFGQTDAEKAKIYFSQFADSKAVIEFCARSLPTLEECKMVFKDEYAGKYFASLEHWKTELTEETKNNTIKFYGLKITLFTAEDVRQDKGNYASGMKSIVNELQPNVTFCNFNMQQNAGDEGYGINYQSAVYLNGRWIFFPKPWRLF